jgi:hypothetical protein
MPKSVLLLLFFDVIHQFIAQSVNFVGELAVRRVNGLLQKGISLIFKHLNNYMLELLKDLGQLVPWRGFAPKGSFGVIRAVCRSLLNVFISRKIYP